MSKISNSPRLWLLTVFLVALTVSWTGIRIHINLNWAALWAFFAGYMIAYCETAIRLRKAPVVVPQQLESAFGFNLFLAIVVSITCLAELINTLTLPIWHWRDYALYGATIVPILIGLLVWKQYKK